MPREDLHYKLLRQLTSEPASATQRGLAARLGVSVGKINYCIRALAGKGWVKVRNFQRSDNKLAYAYLLTPAGAVAKARLTKEFLAQKEQEFEALQVEIRALRAELNTAQEPERTNRR